MKRYTFEIVVSVFVAILSAFAFRNAVIIRTNSERLKAIETQAIRDEINKKTADRYTGSMAAVDKTAVDKRLKRLEKAVFDEGK